MNNLTNIDHSNSINIDTPQDVNKINKEIKQTITSTVKQPQNGNLQLTHNTVKFTSPPTNNFEKCDAQKENISDLNVEIQLNLVQKQKISSRPTVKSKQINTFENLKNNLSKSQNISDGNSKNSDDILLSLNKNDNSEEQQVGLNEENPPSISLSENNNSKSRDILNEKYNDLSPSDQELYLDAQLEAKIKQPLDEFYKEEGVNPEDFDSESSGDFDEIMNLLINDSSSSEIEDNEGIDSNPEGEDLSVSENLSVEDIATDIVADIAVDSSSKRDATELRSPNTKRTSNDFQLGNYDKDPQIPPQRLLMDAVKLLKDNNLTDIKITNSIDAGLKKQVENGETDPPEFHVESYLNKSGDVCYKVKVNFTITGKNADGAEKTLTLSREFFVSADNEKEALLAVHGTAKGIKNAALAPEDTTSRGKFLTATVFEITLKRDGDGQVSGLEKVTAKGQKIYAPDIRRTNPFTNTPSAKGAKTFEKGADLRMREILNDDALKGLNIQGERMTKQQRILNDVIIKTSLKDSHEDLQDRIEGYLNKFDENKIEYDSIKSTYTDPTNEKNKLNNWNLKNKDLENRLLEHARAKPKEQFPDEIDWNKVPGNVIDKIKYERNKANTQNEIQDLEKQITEIESGFISRISNKEKKEELIEEREKLQMKFTEFDDYLGATQRKYEEAIKGIHNDRNKLIRLHMESKQLNSHLNEINNQIPDFDVKQNTEGRDMEAELNDQANFLKNFALQNNTVRVSTNIPSESEGEEFPVPGLFDDFI
ncbi:MAG: hypothetical protein H0V82_04365 [Candidatus Protochlamydia sp.]|nr:hypothetical protein [Candidatus Protochlamydia sp.]